MSLDLWIVRHQPLSWNDVVFAFDALASGAGLSRWAMPGAEESTTAYFWNVGRVTVSRVIPDPEEVQDDDPPELSQPYIEISSRAGAWPWIEWTAIELAKKLSARVYDPQNAEMLVATEPEHDHAALLAMHAAYLRDEKPTLKANWWASAPTRDGTPEALRVCARMIDGVAKEALGVDHALTLSNEQVNLWHTYELANGVVQVSTSTDGDLNSPTTSRSFHVAGKADDVRAAAFAEKLASAFGLRFSRVDEWSR